MSQALVRAGARVVLMDIDADTLERTANEVEELGGRGCVTRGTPATTARTSGKPTPKPGSAWQQ
jgi:hypothetical protein